MADKSKIDSIGVGLVLVAAIAFSAKAIFVKLAYDDPTLLKNAVDPITLLMLRMGCHFRFLL